MPSQAPAAFLFAASSSVPPSFRSKTDHNASELPPHSTLPILSGASNKVPPTQRYQLEIAVHLGDALCR